MSSVKFSFHLFQSFNKSSGNVSSQRSFSYQVFCKTLFAGNWTGPIIPRGSKIELNVDKHLRRVSFPGRPDGGDVLTTNVSVSTTTTTISFIFMTITTYYSIAKAT